MDYSVACITGLPIGISPQAVVDILHGLGFTPNIDNVRISDPGVSREVRATVRMEDPSFARELSATLRNKQSSLSAAPLASATARTDCRKVCVSWHKATRNVWLNFGSGEIANRVAQKFNEGKYTCLGRQVKSSAGKRSTSYSKFSKNPVPWTIILSDVPREATIADIKSAITLSCDQSRHIEMGPANYQASDEEVSLEVRSQLKGHGPLETFYLAHGPTGKRVKVTALFQDELDAKSAHALHDKPLSIIGNGKLTVVQMSSAKMKVSAAIYAASKTRVDQVQTGWTDHRLKLRIYTDLEQRFTTLKVEGDIAKDVADTRKKLDRILSGEIITDGNRALWSPAFSTNGSATRALKSIEVELKVLIIRNKSLRQLRFHGSSEKFQQAVGRIVDLLKDETPSNHDISLSADSLSWAIQGGFKKIQQSLGKDVVVFDLVSRRIVVRGTNEQHALALSIMQDQGASSLNSVVDSDSSSKGDCPICYCEPDNPITTTCKHTYCLQCFEDYCKFAASNSKEEFRVGCQGMEGQCPTTFTLHELKARISSFTFEDVLQSSFKEYIQRHPETFRYCPTAKCGFIYRCSTTSGTGLSDYVCPNCLLSLCTSCQAQHGDHTCAEYKDIASGSVEALKEFKKQNNIKDCPKCSTSMMKSEGCNHMTCAGCKTHICWVCMSVFETSGLCYSHMIAKHGSIGLGLEQF
jgi:hypothetical protein